MTISRHSSTPLSATKTLLLAASAMSCALAATPTMAQTVLETIIVQADRSPLQREQVGRSLTVITSDQIETMKAAYVTDVLRQVPGVAVAASGPAGTQTHVRIRGGDPAYTLVMIDGVVANSAGDGTFDFGLLQLGEVERVEILRGPQGAFWGTNAISGVVNIVTKAGIRSGLRTTLGTEFGSDGTRMGSVLLQYGQDNFNASGSFKARHTDGFNVSSFGDEKDGADHVDANLKFRADVSPSLTLDGNLRYGHTLSNFDEEPTMGDSFASTLSKELQGAIGGRWTSEDRSWFQSARFSVARLNAATDGDWYPDRDFSTARYKGTYQVGRTFYTPEFTNSEHTLTGGYDLTHETYTDSGRPDTYWRTTHSLTGEYRGRFENQFYLTAALRHDFNDQFKDFTSYSLSGAWQIPDSGTRLHASVGTGSANPSFTSMYYGFMSSFVPNPNLKPEQTFGWDIGVEQKFFDGQLTLDATLFGQEVEDLITSSGPSVHNVAGISTRKGLELTGTLDFLNGFVASASYTYTDARDPSGATELRKPAHLGVINLAYTFEEVPLTIHGSASFAGEAQDAVWLPPTWTPTPVTLAAFTDLSAGLNYKVNENVEVYGRVTNILDTPNQSVYGYNLAGRAFYLGAKASF